MSRAAAGQIFVLQETRLRAANAAALKWHTWPYCVMKGMDPDTQRLHELLWDGGETRGEPKERRLPGSFRINKNSYIARPELERDITEFLTKPTSNTEAPAIITLRGPGGMGITRLAEACALRAAHTYPDGVFYVSLADRPPSESSLVEAIADALGINPPAVKEILVHALGNKRALLVLDNYDSVLCTEARKGCPYLDLNEFRLPTACRPVLWYNRIWPVALNTGDPPNVLHSMYDYHGCVRLSGSLLLRRYTPGATRPYTGLLSTLR